MGRGILQERTEETEMAGIKTAEYAEQRNRKRTVNLTADGRELTQILREKQEHRKLTDGRIPTEGREGGQRVQPLMGREF